MRIKNLLFLAALAVSATATLTSCEDILGTWDRPTPAAVTPTASVAVTGITLDDEATVNVGGTVTLTATVAPDNATDKSVIWSSIDESVATVADGVVTGVAAGTAIITATANDGSGVKATCTVTVKIPGLLAGVFTVNNSPLTKVQFSQGNLQYQASTKTWRFAENQYGYVGDAVGNTTSTGRDTQSDWIDLFGWGTAGHSFASGYGTFYQPWETDKTDGTKYGPSGTSNGLYGTYAQGDWGTNMGAGWRTLTNAEWTYLFNTRTVNGGTGNGKSYTLGQSVNGELGIVIYPDDYTGTAYSGSDWSTFEAAGCVFLPAAGYRSVTSVSNAGSDGYYWSSSPHGSSADFAYCINFNSGSLVPNNNRQRYRGHSVRLVRPVE